MTFLPADYKIPSNAGKYLKLQQGENMFRILDSAIVGFEGWTMVDGKKKPIRKRPTDSFKLGEVDETTIKHFWAFPVWNYVEGRVQVAEFTQKSIMGKIEKLAKNKSWGDPTGYDIVIHREGEGMETEYEVTPEPKSELAPEAAEAWRALKPTFDVSRLFDGGDPFVPPTGDKEEINVDDIPF